MWWMCTPLVLTKPHSSGNDVRIWKVFLNSKTLLPSICSYFNVFSQFLPMKVGKSRSEFNHWLPSFFAFEPKEMFAINGYEWVQRAKPLMVPRSPFAEVCFICFFKSRFPYPCKCTEWLAASAFERAISRMCGRAVLIEIFMKANAFLVVSNWFTLAAAAAQPSSMLNCGKV